MPYKSYREAYLAATQIQLFTTFDLKSSDIYESHCKRQIDIMNKIQEIDNQISNEKEQEADYFDKLTINNRENRLGVFDIKVSDAFHRTLEKNLKSLNDKQKKIFDRVIGTIQAQNIASKNTKTNASLPIDRESLRLFVSGVAG